MTDNVERIKISRFLLAACVILGISVGYASYYAIINYHEVTGLTKDHYLKMSPFAFVSISMAIYIWDLVRRIKKKSAMQ